jgi:hypothetical protein
MHKYGTSHQVMTLLSEQNLFASNFPGTAYQVRTWQGWHHHMALSLIAVWFLIVRQVALKRK